MKRRLIFPLLLAGLLGSPPASPAQDAAALAAREEAEARYTRLNTRVQEMEETLQSHQKRIMALTEEVHNLGQEVTRLKNKNESAAIQESLKGLAEKIEEVDKKRRADNELVLAQIKSLGATVLARPPAAEKPPKSSSIKPPNGNVPPGSNAPPGDGGKPASAVPENGYEYVIKKGDTLDRIVRDLKAGGIKVTQTQIENANPGVNWNKLKINQKIFIPAPPQ